MDYYIYRPKLCRNEYLNDTIIGRFIRKCLFVYQAITVQN